MKKAIVLMALVLLVLSCATTPEKASGPGIEGERVPEVENLLKQWQKALKKEDIHLFMETYWPDAILDVIRKDGTSESFFSADAIREYQRGLFEEHDYSRMKLPEYQLQNREHDPELVVYRLEYEEAREFIVFHERDGKWKIQRQEFINNLPGAWVTSRFQAAADMNENGFIDNREPLEEHTRLVEEILRPLLYEPHEVRNTADDLFDENRDGIIDEQDIDRVRHLLFIENPLSLAEINPERFIPQYDLNDDGHVRPEEMEQLLEFLFGDPELRQPRQTETDLDRRVDLNGDGRIDEREIEEQTWRLIHLAGIVQFRDEVLMEAPRKVSNYLDQVADENGDGTVDEGEHEILLRVMEREHEVVSPVGWKLDLNKNGHLDANEIMLARQSYALGKQMHIEHVDPPFEVITAVDEILDLNGNGRVENDEIEKFVMIFAVQEPIEDAPERLMNLFDQNRDGAIQPYEMEDAKGFFIYPHPVDPDNELDSNGDRNRDGFVDPEEMGITAGVTGKGETLGFDVRIKNARWAARRQKAEIYEGKTEQGLSSGEAREEERSFQSEYYKKLGTIQDRKLAIVGLSIGTASVNQETANGLIVFVENAFVNIGKVRVVDRKNIEKIMEEYKFQASALTDESTAVEIGKLSGADIIVIGSINFVGKKYYLNIKLINVETGEIIGSSIAEAEDESRFLDMSNKAVYNLF